MLRLCERENGMDSLDYSELDELFEALLDSATLYKKLVVYAENSLSSKSDKEIREILWNRHLRKSPRTWKMLRDRIQLPSRKAVHSPHYYLDEAAAQALSWVQEELNKNTSRQRQEALNRWQEDLENPGLYAVEKKLAQWGSFGPQEIDSPLETVTRQVRSIFLANFCGKDWIYPE